jgi:hypothetical protein
MDSGEGGFTSNSVGFRPSVRFTQCDSLNHISLFARERSAPDYTSLQLHAHADSCSLYIRIYAYYLAQLFRSKLPKL